MILKYQYKEIEFPLKFDVTDQKNDVLYRVETKLNWGHTITITTIHKEKVAHSDDNITSYFPSFKLHVGDATIGHMKRVFSLKEARFDVQVHGWMIRGLMFEDHYDILDRKGKLICEYRTQGDRHTLNIKKPALHKDILLFVLTCDALMELNK